MLRFTAGEDVTLVVPFLADGEYATPDADSVVYSVRDNAGALFPDYTAVPYAHEGADRAIITLPASINAKTLTTEYRTLIVSYAVEGKPFRAACSYRLDDWLNITVGAAEVRAQLGLSAEELPDEDIDLPKAYYSLDRDLGDGLLSAALSAGGVEAQFANDAVVYRAVLDLLPSLRLRVLVEEKSSTTSYRRLAEVDFDALTAAFSSMLEDVLTSVAGGESTYAVPFVASTRTDPVTGS